MSIYDRFDLLPENDKTRLGARSVKQPEKTRLRKFVDFQWATRPGLFNRKSRGMNRQFRFYLRRNLLPELAALELFGEGVKWAVDKEGSQSAYIETPGSLDASQVWSIVYGGSGQAANAENLANERVVPKALDKTDYWFRPLAQGGTPEQRSRMHSVVASKGIGMQGFNEGRYARDYELFCKDENNARKNYKTAWMIVNPNSGTTVGQDFFHNPMDGGFVDGNLPLLSTACLMSPRDVDYVHCKVIGSGQAPVGEQETKKRFYDRIVSTREGHRQDHTLDVDPKLLPVVQKRMQMVKDIPAGYDKGASFVAMQLLYGVWTRADLLDKKRLPMSKKPLFGKMNEIALGADDPPLDIMEDCVRKTFEIERKFGPSAEVTLPILLYTNNSKNAERIRKTIVDSESRLLEACATQPDEMCMQTCYQQIIQCRNNASNITLRGFISEGYGAPQHPEHLNDTDKVWDFLDKDYQGTQLEDGSVVNRLDAVQNAALKDLLDAWNKKTREMTNQQIKEYMQKMYNVSARTLDDKLPNGSSLRQELECWLGKDAAVSIGKVQELVGIMQMAEDLRHRKMPNELLRRDNRLFSKERKVYLENEIFERGDTIKNPGDFKKGRSPLNIWWRRWWKKDPPEGQPKFSNWREGGYRPNAQYDSSGSSPGAGSSRTRSAGNSVSAPGNVPSYCPMPPGRSASFVTGNSISMVDGTSVQRSLRICQIGNKFESLFMIFSE